MGRVRFLLDTHTLLWALAEPEKLSPQVHSILKDPANLPQVSTVSLFEIATKVRIGKLSCPVSLLENWEFTLARLGASLLPLLGAEAVRAGRWQVEHRDPFDRLLAAQAYENNLCLLSRDQAFSQFKDLNVMW